LYPREYRDLFGPEVLSVFAEAAREHRARGLGVWAWFLVTELSGAVVSAAGHWIDRFSARGYPASCPELADTNLTRMTKAIANRDFAAARAYSIEDLKMRDRYGLDGDEMALR
jgi:hypothetical protein